MREAAITFALGLACLRATFPARIFTGDNGSTTAAPDGRQVGQHAQTGGHMTLIPPDKECLVSVQLLPAMGMNSK